MTRDELNNEYFDWMYGLVNGDRYPSGRCSYRLLFMELHRLTFNYTFEMDANRASDGADLRYRFGSQNSYAKDDIKLYLDYRPCSVLEMMVALAIRCEEHIMDDPEIGNRTYQWFWNMVVNLGLGSMTDTEFNRKTVDDAIFAFMDHDYAPDGTGGLFKTSRANVDMRKLDIWYQMNNYLNDIL